MYVSWVLGDKLRIVMSSIMRWRRGEIGLVIGGLLSVGLHERAILADRTPPTMIQLRLGRPTAKRNLRTKVSKPQKPTILDWSHQPHHRRLPRQRFSATGVTEYWIGLPCQSGLILAARITLPHFSVSSAMNFPNSEGEL